MKVTIAFIFKAAVLSLVVHQSITLAQEPLELVTLSDKGGLLPPEDKNAKEEASKNAAPKSTAPIKKVSSASASSRSTYIVKPGDTLDKVIAQNYADSVQKSEALRKELMALNPMAFSKGNPKMLLSGATLKLPNAEQLLSKQAGNAGTTWSGEKAKLAMSGYTTYPPVYANAESSEKRRHWVQYP
jgi:hypothetical protein